MIKFNGNELHVNGSVFKLEFPIQEAREFGSQIIVLFRPDASKAPGQFRNLVAYDSKGRIIWEAELPTSYSMDAYYQLLPGPRLVADSYCSYRCQLDPATGRITSKEYYK